MITAKEYYEVIDSLRPNRGIMTEETKAEIAEIIGCNPEEIIRHADKREIDGVLCYLSNNFRDNVPMFESFRYKDCLFCKEYESDRWIVYRKDPEEQLWDLFDLFFSSEDRNCVEYASTRIVQTTI